MNTEGHHLFLSHSNGQPYHQSTPSTAGLCNNSQQHAIKPNHLFLPNSNGQFCNQSTPPTTPNSPDISLQHASQQHHLFLPHSKSQSDNQSTPPNLNPQPPARKPVEFNDVTTLSAIQPHLLFLPHFNGQSYNQSTPPTSPNLPNISQPLPDFTKGISGTSPGPSNQHLFLPHSSGQPYNQSAPSTSGNPYNISQLPARKPVGFNDVKTQNAPLPHLLPHFNNIFQPLARKPEDLSKAISYLLKVKDRFLNQPEVYPHFVKLCQTYERQEMYIKDMVPFAVILYSEVAKLFQDQEDLLQEFAHFLPDDAAYALGLQPVNDVQLSEAMRK